MSNILVWLVSQLADTARLSIAYGTITDTVRLQNPKSLAQSVRISPCCHLSGQYARYVAAACFAPAVHPCECRMLIMRVLFSQHISGIAA